MYTQIMEPLTISTSTVVNDNTLAPADHWPLSLISKILYDSLFVKY